MTCRRLIPAVLVRHEYRGRWRERGPRYSLPSEATTASRSHWGAWTSHGSSWWPSERGFSWSSRSEQASGGSTRTRYYR